jgi:hypothetical protein
MQSLRLLVCLLLLSSLALVQAQAPPPLTPQMSPIVTWDAERDISRPPTKRPLTAAELKAARARADRFFDLVKATPTFSQPAKHVTLVTAWPVVLDDGALSERFYAYRSAPADVRIRPDGSLWPKMGGAHTVLFFQTNYPPLASHLEDRGVERFSRTIEGDGAAYDVFSQPRTFAEVGGGTLYNGLLVITRDGRSILEPAPLGPILAGEIARYQKSIADLDRGTKSSLEQLEASMTPQAKAERRAKRAERWKTQFRNPATLASELDAADKSDEADYQRQKERLTPPAMRDPKSVYWGYRLALEALETRLASLDEAGRRGGACGRMDPVFSPQNGARFEPAAAGSTGCGPIVRIRRDLVDLKRPNAVQLLTLFLPDEPCGEQWAGKAMLQSDRCDVAVPLMRELDWTAMRAVMGW